MEFQVPRGTKDILPQEVYYWQEVEEKSRQIFSRYNFSEIRTPIFENIDLFQRSLGATTEIVQKQMFSFKQGDDHFVLRPEGTASNARAYIEHSLGFGQRLQKLYYIGPMFRAERPQKGRLRQFHHIGAEAIGSSNPYLDIEIMELADSLLGAFGVSNYTFLVNSLGCKDDKAKLSDWLKMRLTPHKKELCDDCQERLGRNVFRVLDCKKEPCRKIIDGIGLTQSHLCSSCKASFDTVLSGIKDCSINYKVSAKLVRGLDYYSGIVFEIVHPDLGAQDALGAGGRYNYLFEELLGKQIGAVGFALGVERLMLVLPEHQKKEQLHVYIIALGEAAAQKTVLLAKEIRKAGFRCDVDYSQTSLKSKLKEANKIEARFALIIGDDELKADVVTLRSMHESTEEKIAFSEMVATLRKRIGKEGAAEKER